MNFRAPDTEGTNLTNTSVTLQNDIDVETGDSRHPDHGDGADQRAGDRWLQLKKLATVL